MSSISLNDNSIRLRWQNTIHTTLLAINRCFMDTLMRIINGGSNRLANRTNHTVMANRSRRRVRRRRRIHYSGKFITDQSWTSSGGQRQSMHLTYTRQSKSWKRLLACFIFTTASWFSTGKLPDQFCYMLGVNWVVRYIGNYIMY